MVNFDDARLNGFGYGRGVLVRESDLGVLVGWLKVLMLKKPLCGKASVGV